MFTLYKCVFPGASGQGVLYCIGIGIVLRKESYHNRGYWYSVVWELEKGKWDKVDIFCFLWGVEISSKVVVLMMMMMMKWRRQSVQKMQQNFKSKKTSAFLYNFG